uniref:SAP domain-containing protein n=1 Tax=Macrostomum lignano TaxID=282301 RepID=A0A1I8JHK6_9PLAT
RRQRWFSALFAVRQAKGWHPVLGPRSRGAYKPESTNKEVYSRAPAYSFGLRHHQSQRVHAGPHAGQDFARSEKKAAPSYTLVGRSKVGGFHEDLQKTPGPGAYSVVPAGRYRHNPPAYSLTSRNSMPGDSTTKPGPGAHSPETNFYRMKRAAPAFSFGIRHSQYKGEFITDADMEELRMALRAKGLQTVGNKRTLLERLLQSQGSVDTGPIDESDTSNPSRRRGPDDGTAAVGGGEAAGGTHGTGDLDRDLREAEKQLRLLTIRRDQARLEAEIRQLDRRADEPQRRPANASVPGEYSSLEDLVLGPTVRVPDEVQQAGQQHPNAYRVPEFISARKRLALNKSSQASKQAALDSLSVGDWITGNANALMQMLKDGRLLVLRDGAIDMSELLEYLKHTAKIGDLLDLGFDRGRVLRYDDEYRAQQAEAGAWDSSVTDLGLVAAHLMAPNLQLQAGSAGRSSAKRPVCFDFNKALRPGALGGLLPQSGGRPGGKKLMDGVQRQGSLNIESPAPAAASVEPQKEGDSSGTLSTDLRLEAWRLELADTEMPTKLAQFVLSGVKDGFRIRNVSSPVDSVEQENYGSIGQHRVEVQAQVRRELQAGRYRVSAKPTIVSALGAIPKSGGGIRLIHDCSQPQGRAVNDLFACQQKLRFSSAAAFARKLRQDMYMCKVDLSQAYRSCGIHPDDHCLTGLKFTFEGEAEPTYMVDTRLPFGAAASVSSFFQISNAIRFMMLKRRFFNFEVYMDDFGFAGSLTECWRFYNKLTQLLQSLGLTVNWKKCVQPTQEMCFLGIQFNTQSGLMSLPETKVEELQACLDLCCTKRRISKHELQKLVGRLNWACQVVCNGRPFLRDLIDRVNDLSSPKDRLLVDGQFKSVLSWWKVALRQQPGRELWPAARRPVAMETDACLVGAAAVLRDPAGSDWCYLQWEVDAGSEFSDCCINYKEAAAVLLALLHWRRQLHNCRIAVYCDNAAACAIINKGSSREPRLLRLLQTVALLCLKQNIVVTAHHVPGRFQLFADAASRLHCRQELLNFLLRAYATASAYASSSKRSLSSAVRSWQRFCRERRLDPLGCRAEDLANYVGQLVDGRLSSFGSVRVHISALSASFRLAGVPDLTRHPLLHLVLRGAKRELGSEPSRKLPVSPDLLSRLRLQVDSSNPVQAACWAAVMCAWWGMFRKSSLLPRGRADPPVLRLSSLARCPEGLLLTSSFGKTNQYGRTHRVLLPELTSGHPLCPVAALRGHLRCNRLKRRQQGLFSFSSGSSGHASLTSRRLDVQFRSWLGKAGVPAAGFSVHSLRRGAATWAARCGLSVREIQCVGDWRSDAVSVYLSRDDTALRAARKLAIGEGNKPLDADKPEQDRAGVHNVERYNAVGNEFVGQFNFQQLQVLSIARLEFVQKAQAVVGDGLHSAASGNQHCATQSHAHSLRRAGQSHGGVAAGGIPLVQSGIGVGQQQQAGCDEERRVRMGQLEVVHGVQERLSHRRTGRPGTPNKILDSLAEPHGEAPGYDHTPTNVAINIPEPFDSSILSGSLSSSSSSMEFNPLSLKPMSRPHRL